MGTMRDLLGLGEGQARTFPWLIVPIVLTIGICAVRDTGFVVTLVAVVGVAVGSGVAQFVVLQRRIS